MLVLARLGVLAAPPPGVIGPSEDADLRRALLLAARLDRVSQFLHFRESCLPRAIALHRILDRRGIPATFWLGSRLVQGKLESHAWIEVSDSVVIGALPDLDSYNRFVAVPD